MYADWQLGLGKILEERANNGKTLVVGVTLPKMRFDYGGYSVTKQMNLINFNSHIMDHGITDNYVKFVVADTENIPHDANDDGLHFLAPGYGQLETIILNAIAEGLE